VDVDNGIGVNVGVPADGADVAVLAADRVAALVVSCACTVMQPRSGRHQGLAGLECWMADCKPALHL